MRQQLPIAGCFGLLALALLIGGGTTSYHLGDLLLQLLAALLLAAGLGRLLLLQGRGETISVDRRQLLWLATATMGVMLLQFLPLPAAIWAALPGRAELAQNHAQLGLDTPAWLAWSTEPNASAATLRALLPALALLVLGVQLDDDWRRRLLWLPLLLALLSVPFGLLQVSQGTASELRFYSPTNHHEAVGFFANRNHFAALLYVGMALCFGYFLSYDRRFVGRGPIRFAHALGWMTLITLLLLGLLLARSRAGVGLALFTLGAMSLIGLAWLRSVRWTWIAGGLLLVLLIGFGLGYDAVSARMESDWLADNRWRVSAAAFALAMDYGWLGSGAGSFPAAYAAFEPIDLVGDKIINHAHNDWFELLVELGWSFVLLIGLLGWWLARRLRSLLGPEWRALAPTTLAAGVAFTALLIHSGVDYPLRTSAMMLVCTALLLQFLTPTQAPAAGGSRRSRRRRPAEPEVPRIDNPFEDEGERRRLRLVGGRDQGSSNVKL
jgi:hypothetical protein